MKRKTFLKTLLGLPFIPSFTKVIKEKPKSIEDIWKQASDAERAAAINALPPIN